jgi:hypothetical protein
MDVNLGKWILANQLNAHGYTSRIINEVFVTIILLCLYSSSSKQTDQKGNTARHGKKMGIVIFVFSGMFALFIIPSQPAGDLLAGR